VNVQKGADGWKRYAVVARDHELFLLLTVNRSPAGNVYVNLPKGYGDPDWNPHVSYHASGQHHNKSHGQIMGRACFRQKPDEHFKGDEPVIVLYPALGGLIAFRAPYHAEEYAGALEMPAAELKPEGNRSWFRVDLTDAHSQPREMDPGAKVERAAVFTDAVPWIHVRLLDQGAYVCPAVQAAGPG
jgi:hypothetical protein